MSVVFCSLGAISGHYGALKVLSRLFCGRFGTYCGPLGAVSLQFWTVLGCSAVNLRCFCPFGAVLGLFRSNLGPLWGHYETVLGMVGAVLCCFGLF